MPPGFTAALARRLDTLASLTVREAQEGDRLTNGVALLAPGDNHLVIRPDGTVGLDRSPALHGVRPAVDITLRSAAAVFGRRATVAILTGMGKDGAEGAAVVETGGGRVIVQDEATSVVYGMPRAARAATTASIEAPLPRVAQEIVKAVGTTRGVQ